MKLFVLFCFFGASLVYPAIPPPQPILTIGLIRETNAPITVSELGWASLPIVVDLKRKVMSLPASGCQFGINVVCSEQPVLAIGILAPSGHTNEIEWSADLRHWTPSNVRWISDGQAVRYYIPAPVNQQYYRVKESNGAPSAGIEAVPLTGGLFTHATGSTPDAPGPTPVLPAAEPSDARKLVVVSPNNRDAIVMLDGSSSSDPENDPLEYAWEEGTTAFATTVNTTKRFEIGDHPITLKVSDGLATGTASVVLETIKASTAVDRLSSLVRKDADLKLVPRNPRPLLATLEAAAAAFDRGKMISGMNHLQAFQNQVRAQTAPSEQSGADLIQAAEEIIRAVTNSGA